MRPAAFLDRDGVLNADSGYVWRITDFQWLPGVVQALQHLQQAGYALVVVTNQSGIARGLYTEADFAALSHWMTGELRGQGVELAGIYHCPHAPPHAGEAGCTCRKPLPGMVLSAAAELDLDLARSVLFGDKPQDIEAGRVAGVRHCVRIRSAYGDDDEGQPDACFDSLLQACQTGWVHA